MERGGEREGEEGGRERREGGREEKEGGRKGEEGKKGGEGRKRREEGGKEGRGGKEEKGRRRERRGGKEEKWRDEGKKEGREGRREGRGEEGNERREGGIVCVHVAVFSKCRTWSTCMQLKMFCLANLDPISPCLIPQRKWDTNFSQSVVTTVLLRKPSLPVGLLPSLALLATQILTLIYRFYIPLKPSTYM